jgi:hypothetical protein
MPNNKNVYMCAIYMSPDKNVYYMYRKYNIDVFDVLQEHIEHFSALGTVSIIGDINGRVGIESDFILDDMTLQPFLFWKVNLLLSTPNPPLHILNPVDLHSSNIRRPKLFGTFRSKTGYDTNRWNEGFKDDIFERHDDECSEV